MLALIAMENPKELKAERIRKERAKILSKVTVNKKSIVRVQYAGFREEKGVASDSATETYFRLEAAAGNTRWRGTPFILESGKALAENEVSISVFFKPAPCLCPGLPVRDSS